METVVSCFVDVRKFGLAIGHQEAVTEFHGTGAEEPSSCLRHPRFDLAQLHPHPSNLHLEAEEGEVKKTLTKRLFDINSFVQHFSYYFFQICLDINFSFWKCWRSDLSVPGCQIFPPLPTPCPAECHHHRYGTICQAGQAVPQISPQSTLGDGGSLSHA